MAGWEQQQREADRARTMSEIADALARLGIVVEPDADPMRFVRHLTTALRTSSATRLRHPLQEKERGGDSWDPWAVSMSRLDCPESAAAGLGYLRPSPWQAWRQRQAARLSQGGADPSEWEDEDLDETDREDAESLAQDLNELEDAGETPSLDELRDLLDDLAGSAWTVALDPDDGRWRAVHVSALVGPDAPVRMSAADSGWVAHTGTRGARKGQQGWKNTRTGRTVYTPQPPGGRKQAQPKVSAAQRKAAALERTKAALAAGHGADVVRGHAKDLGREQLKQLLASRGVQHAKTATRQKLLDALAGPAEPATPAPAAKGKATPAAKAGKGKARSADAFAHLEHLFDQLNGMDEPEDEPAAQEPEQPATQSAGDRWKAMQAEWAKESAEAMQHPAMKRLGSIMERFEADTRRLKAELHLKELMGSHGHDADTAAKLRHISAALAHAHGTDPVLMSRGWYALQALQHKGVPIKLSLSDLRARLPVRPLPASRMSRGPSDARGLLELLASAGSSDREGRRWIADSYRRITGVGKGDL